ncbi:MAG TPA: hypothetical protein VEJ45_03875 [Candidatus Acidoferrales bacterium]|nr:hypothetical protein [Candidatus Acidoferrales bacterium]
MRRSTTLVGAVFILLGLLALIHPRVEMPARKTEVQVVGQKLLIETRRIVTIPSILSGLLVVAGMSLMIFGPRKR